jgi:hypothetical protein
MKMFANYRLSCRCLHYNADVAVRHIGTLGDRLWLVGGMFLGAAYLLVRDFTP